MSGQTLYDKLWSAHVVNVEDDGTTLLYIDRHLVHEVTSPQAFEGLRRAGRRPDRTTLVRRRGDSARPDRASQSRPAPGPRLGAMRRGNGNMHDSGRDVTKARMIDRRSTW